MKGNIIFKIRNTFKKGLGTWKYGVFKNDIRKACVTLLTVAVFCTNSNAQKFKIIQLAANVQGFNEGFLNTNSISDKQGFSNPKLLSLNDGFLYGVYNEGGSANNGTIFKMKADGSQFSVIKNLNNNTTGSFPTGSLVSDASGYLYGTASQGGSKAGGTIFKVKTDGTNFTVLFNFDSATGANPVGALTLDKAGNIFGTTTSGGASSVGTIFTLKTDGTKFTILKNLSVASTGSQAAGALTLGSDGFLYGCARTGGAYFSGTVFKIKTDGTGFLLLRQFQMAENGGQPNGGLVLDANNYLYGMNSMGGHTWSGTVFKLKTDGSDFGLLQQFDDFEINGSRPDGGLTLGADNNLYGITTRGGSSGSGTTFKISKAGDYEVLRSFNYAVEGRGTGSLAVDVNSSKVFGYTAGGKANNAGSIFSFTTTPIDPVVNSTLPFNGKDQYVQIPTNPTLEFLSGTIEMWVKPTWTPGSHNNANPALIAERSTSATRFSIHMLNDLSGIGIWNGNIWQYVNYDFTSGSWAHIACVISPSDTKFYVNGSYIGQTFNGLNLDVTGLDLSIGASMPGVNDEAFQGELNEIRIWNVARTDDEIASHFADTVNYLNTNLVGYYPVDDNVTGDQNAILRRLSDSSTTHAHATMYNYWNTVKSLQVSKVSSNSICAGSEVAVAYVSNVTFGNGNKFSLQLSDANGDFTNPTVLDSLLASLPDTFKVKLPAHFASGEGYRFRVTSTNPVVTGSISDVINIHDRPVETTIFGKGTAITNVTYKYSIPEEEGSTWKWLASTNFKQVDNTITIQWPDTTGKQDLQVIETNKYGCSGDTTFKTIVMTNVGIQKPNITVSGFCPGSQANITAGIFGKFSSKDNYFVAQLSDAYGSFDKPMNIGKIKEGSAGGSQTITIPVIIPSTLRASENYRIRIMANTPGYASADNGSDIQIRKPQIGGHKDVAKCIGSPVDLTTMVNLEGLTAVWSTPNPSAVTEPGTYTVIGFNLSGCSDTLTFEVKDFAKPQLGENTFIKLPYLTPVDLTGMLNMSGDYDYRWNTQMPKAATEARRYRLIAINGGCRDTAYVRVVYSNVPYPERGIDHGQFNDVNELQVTNESLQATIYPNPSASNAMLQLTSLVPQQYTVSIADVSGKQLWKSVYAKTSTVSLPVQTLSRGIYNVTIKTGTEIKTLRLVRQ